jgi:hypothetical protein
MGSVPTQWTETDAWEDIYMRFMWLLWWGCISPYHLVATSMLLTWGWLCLRDEITAILGCAGFRYGLGSLILYQLPVEVFHYLLYVAELSCAQQIFFCQRGWRHCFNSSSSTGSGLCKSDNKRILWEGQKLFWKLTQIINCCSSTNSKFYGKNWALGSVKINFEDSSIPEIVASAGIVVKDDAGMVIFTASHVLREV